MQITASNWQVLSPLLDEALLLAPTARVTWLDGQTQLSGHHRAQLERLIALANAPETDTIFQNLPGLLRASTDPPGAAVPHASGDIVGAYELLRTIGRGGMAEVWLARRSDGAYERDIALKLPLSHLPYNVAAERLLRERNVLASLEHPSIARFYDAGVAADGQPFLAMEYVEGESIVDYGNRMQLDLRARCKLMLHVLDALHYAHQHLVVHRDLKPSNILVRADGRVTLLDFGIAKVLESPDAATLATELTQVMGSAMTLAYAAPEQLLAEPVTTATDLYSAGVVMFELLTGTRPFASAERSASALLLAMEGTAVPTRINSTSEAKAKAHGSDSTRAWQRAFQGDLAAICTRALRLEPADRYASAQSMREDLTRYFDNRPVQARAGAWAYRWRKFFERNRVAVAVSTVTGATALALAAHAWQKTQDLRVSTARATAIEAVVKNMFDGMNPNNNATRTFTAKELLDRSRPLLMQAAAGSADAKSQTTLMMANLYLDVSAIDDARRLLKDEVDDARAANDVRREIWALCLLADADYLSDKPQLAYDAMRAAQERVERLTRNPDALHAQVGHRIGVGALILRQFDEADRVYRSVRSELRALDDQPLDLLVSVLSKQASLAQFRGDLTGAREFLGQAQALLASTQGMQLNKYLLVVNQLQIEYAAGNYDAVISAAETLEPALSSRTSPSSQWSLSSAITYANALIRTGRFAAASEQARNIRDRVDENSKDYLNHVNFIDAQIALFSGQTDQALTTFSAMLAAAEAKARTPTVASERARRSVSHGLLQQGRTDEALMLLRQNEKNWLGIAANANHLDLALTRVLMGCALLRQQRWDDSRVVLTQARDVLLGARGSRYYGSLLAETYLALLPANGPATTTEVQALAARIQHELGWQHGANELSSRLRGESRSAMSGIPALL